MPLTKFKIPFKLYQFLNECSFFVPGPLSGIHTVCSCHFSLFSDCLQLFLSLSFSFYGLDIAEISCFSDCSLLQACLVSSCDRTGLLHYEAIWKLLASEIRKGFLRKGRGEGVNSLGLVEMHTYIHTYIYNLTHNTHLFTGHSLLKTQATRYVAGP